VELILLVYSSGQVILFKLFFEKDRLETTFEKVTPHEHIRAVFPPYIHYKDGTFYSTRVPPLS
jgi:hypothetical protein